MYITHRSTLLLILISLTLNGDQRSKITGVYKKEKKYITELRHTIRKHGQLCSGTTCLENLIPTLAKVPSEQVYSIQEDIDHTVLHRLNIIIAAYKSLGKNFDPHITIHDKTLLQHTVENGYVLATNRLLSEYADIEPSLFALSLKHGTPERICEINTSLKRRLKNLNKIDIIPRSHAKKVCHLYKKLKLESPNNASYNHKQYKKWHKLYKSLKK